MDRLKGLDVNSLQQKNQTCLAYGTDEKACRSDQSCEFDLLGNPPSCRLNLETRNQIREIARTFNINPKFDEPVDDTLKSIQLAIKNLVENAQKGLLNQQDVQQVQEIASNAQQLNPADRTEALIEAIEAPDSPKPGAGRLSKKQILLAGLLLGGVTLAGVAFFAPGAITAAATAAAGYLPTGVVTAGTAAASAASAAWTAFQAAAAQNLAAAQEWLVGLAQTMNIPGFATPEVLETALNHQGLTQFVGRGPLPGPDPLLVLQNVSQSVLDQGRANPGSISAAAMQAANQLQSQVKLFFDSFGGAQKATDTILQDPNLIAALKQPALLLRDGLYNSLAAQVPQSTLIQLINNVPVNTYLTLLTTGAAVASGAGGLGLAFGAYKGLKWLFGGSGDKTAAETAEGQKSVKETASEREEQLAQQRKIGLIYETPDVALIELQGFHLGPAAKGTKIDADDLLASWNQPRSPVMPWTRVPVSTIKTRTSRASDVIPLTEVPAEELQELDPVRQTLPSPPASRRSSRRRRSSTELPSMKKSTPSSRQEAISRQLFPETSPSTPRQRMSPRQKSSVIKVYSDEPPGRRGTSPRESPATTSPLPSLRETISPRERSISRETLAPFG